MARLACCVIYDVFKVTSRLRKVFQGTAGPFLFSASKHMHVTGSSEWQQDQQADFHVFLCLYQKLSHLYRWKFLTEPFSQAIFALVIWDSLINVQIFSGNILRLWRVLQQKDLWSASHYSGAVSGFSSPEHLFSMVLYHRVISVDLHQKVKGEKSL